MNISTAAAPGLISRPCQCPGGSVSAQSERERWVISGAWNMRDNLLIHTLPCPSQKCCGCRAPSACTRLPAAGRSSHTPGAAARWAYLSALLRRSRTRCLHRGGVRSAGCIGGGLQVSRVHSSHMEPLHSLEALLFSRRQGAADATSTHPACRARPLGPLSPCRRCPDRSPSRQRWWLQWERPANV